MSTMQGTDSGATSSNSLNMKEENFMRKKPSDYHKIRSA
jgi:hypothetical protein